ncbi:MAG TPA: hypothetical protein VKX41_06285 [Alloacidobacterium sp.]|nr:hypothetical protein [Alloacidobacterium sp.]
MIQLQSSALVITVLPEVGGKVAQIHDRSSGHDLLIGPRRPYRTIPMEGDWLQHDTSGMDDCFPNVAQGLYPQVPWSDTHLPDLGEWTHGTWNVADATPSRIVLERSGTILPYFAQKTVRLADDRHLEFSYVVENRGVAPIRYLWSAHPLISVPSSFAIEVPPGKLIFRTFPHDGHIRSWPRYENVDLSREWIARGENLKVFITGMAEGWCTLHLPSHSLRFTFGLESIPILGLWFNNYGFPAGEDAFRCIAVEPCTSPSDLLDELAPSAYPVLGLSERMEWSLSLHVSKCLSTETE